MVWIIALFMSVSFAKTKKPKADKPVTIKMTKVATCEGSAEKKVLVFKQWHLAPTTVTKGFKEKYPHEKNQTAIYKTLSELVKKKQLEVIVAEGCEGEIDGTFKPVFNGWSMPDLEKQAQTKNFERILTSVPMKVEARWGDKVVTICGDDLAMIKDSQMHLSNLRGWMGFWTRLSEAKPDDEKLKLYSEAAADLLKVPKDTKVEELKAKIGERSLGEIKEFEKSLHDRNGAFVKALGTREFKTAAIVIGGLHAADLKTKLQEAGYGCEVYEPPGYSSQDENLIQEFEKALSN